MAFRLRQSNIYLTPIHPIDRLLPLIICLVFTMVITGCQNQAPFLTGKLPINAPATIIAGEPIHVQVGPVQVSDGISIGLVLVGKHGPRIYNSTFQQGMAEFNIPGDHTLQPGYLAIIAAAQSARGEVGMLLYPHPLHQPYQAHWVNQAELEPNPDKSR